MKKIMIINGVNLCMLGIREPQIYGGKTYIDLQNYIKDECKDLDVSLEFCISNYEGEIV